MSRRTHASDPSALRAAQRRVAEKIAQRIGAAPEQLDPRERFSRFGADSRTMTGVLSELSAEYGRRLDVTLAWSNPTIESLALAIVSGQEPVAATAACGPQTSYGRGHQGAVEPVAVVGMACRFPAAATPGRYFEILLAGTSAVTELPADRFDVASLYDADPCAPGRSSTRWAGLLEAVDGFDAAFFGISAREAHHMDPQQRLVLELAWEALEDAGICPRALQGSTAGVFAGAMWSDYAALRRGALDAIAQHTAVGEDLSVIPARVSYFLGLEGPSLTVNTACSSSLVAVHLACQSLASGDCSLALVAGVNLILAPDSLVAMSKFGAMAPDGRSKAFDARANGYVRGEGGGVVVLKPLSRALGDGDRIHAVIMGSAVNNDGFSNGLTAPNPRAQEAVLRAALHRAGVQPDDVDFIECHGTGTLLGDPIEAGAIGAVLGRSRRRRSPLWLGSSKTNLGHLEAAAGMAGLIKACLAVDRGVVPPNCHFEEPNPHISFEEMHLAVPTRAEPMGEPGRRRIAGVSSFGFGGTNAHVVLGNQPHLRESVSPAPQGVAPRLLFVFGPNGSQHRGMARSLLRDPVFAGAFQACDKAIQRCSGWSVREQLLRDDDGVFERIDIGQPALFAVQVALAAWLEHRGLVPAGILGHSIGEVAAACAARALTVEDAARVAVTRSRLMQESDGRGAMALVDLDPAQLEPFVAEFAPAISIAGFNGPASTVVSGDATAMGHLVAKLESSGAGVHRVKNTSIASHSAQMDAYGPVLLEELRTIHASASDTPVYSTVTGDRIEGFELGAEYWPRNLREPVVFDGALRRALRDGYDAIVEISPHPLLLGAMHEIARAESSTIRILAVQQRDVDPSSALAQVASDLCPAGTPRPSSEPGDVADLFVLSAATPAALRDLANHSADAVGLSGAELADLCEASRTRRAHLRHRLGVVAESKTELAVRLRAIASAAEPRAGDVDPDQRGKLAFVFSGQGPQWFGMGRELMSARGAFRSTMLACDRIVRSEAGWSLWEELHAGEGASRVHEPEVAQPALCAIQVALFSLLRSWGVEPDGVVGHSLGEIAAAHVAGVLPLRDALFMTIARGRAMRGAFGRGAMLAVDSGCRGRRPGRC